MWHFTVIPLELAQEIECRPGGGKITNGIEPKVGPLRVTPKKPCETGTLAFPRSPVARNQSCSQERIRYQTLNDTHTRPVVGPLQISIRERQVHGARKVVTVVGGRFLQQSSVGSRQVAILFSSLGGGFSGPFQRCGDDNHFRFVSLLRRA